MAEAATEGDVARLYASKPDKRQNAVAAPPRLLHIVDTMAEHDPPRDRPSATGPEQTDAPGNARGKGDGRREREAAALRANLLRRRDQRQARAANEPGGRNTAAGPEGADER